MRRPTISEATGRVATSISRRRLFRQGGAVALGAAVMPKLVAQGGQGTDGVLFETRFTGDRLDSRYWNPYICDDPSAGYPWNIQPGVALPSSATGGPNSYQADYDLPSFAVVDDGLRLRAEQGTAASGYSWTGAVVCSRPTDNNFGSGTIYTQGVTFSSGYVEVTAKMPAALDQGMWPAIWFLAAPPAPGDNEIDLFEGGFQSGSTDPTRIMSCNMPGSGNSQVLVDTGVDLSAGYHRYGLEYRPGELVRMYFDDKPVCTYTSNVPTVSYFIILDLAVASANTLGWHSQLTPATEGPFEMLVQQVVVRSLSPAGQG